LKTDQPPGKGPTAKVEEPSTPTPATPRGKQRLALLCTGTGVCSECILSDLDWWNSEVVLIAKIDPGLGESAKRHFPRATVVHDTRSIPDLVQSGKIHVTAPDVWTSQY